MVIGKNMLKKLSTTHVLLIAALVVLGYSLYNYSVSKSSVQDALTNDSSKTGSDLYSSCCSPKDGAVAPSEPLGQNETPSDAQGIQSSSYGLPPSCAKRNVADPAELLPKDENSDWAKLNPVGAGDLQNVNLLQAGYHIGIDTVGQSLRNANLQVRSEPPNPQMTVSPWNNTTIEPDIIRRPLEVGCGPQ